MGASFFWDMADLCPTFEDQYTISNFRHNPSSDIAPYPRNIKTSTASVQKYNFLPTA